MMIKMLLSLFVCLFVVTLFNIVKLTAEVVNHPMRNDRMIMNGDKWRMWEKEVIAHFNILFQNFPLGIEENYFLW